MNDLSWFSDHNDSPNPEPEHALSGYSPNPEPEHALSGYSPNPEPEHALAGFSFQEHLRL